MPWCGQVGEAVIATGKRHKDSDVMRDSDFKEDGPSSAVDGNRRASSVLTTARGPVSPPHIHPDGLGAGRSDQRSEFLRVVTGSLAHPTAPGSRPETQADSSLDRAECTTTATTFITTTTATTFTTTTGTTTTATVTHSGGGSSWNSRGNISTISSYPSMENMRICAEFPRSLLENSTISENDPMQDSLLSVCFAKSENLDYQYDTSARDKGRNEMDYETPPSPPFDPHQADAVSGVVPVAAAAAFTVGCNQSLADRIEGARQCCSAMRVDIGMLSARCDTLFSRLHAIRTHLASLPSSAHGFTTVGTLTSLSLAVDVRQTTSRVRVSSLSSSLPSAVLSCSSVASPSRPEITFDGSVTDSSKTSMSILQRFEKDLSVRLEELTAYVSSSDMQAEQTQEDEGASEHADFADGRPRTCRDLRDLIPVSSGCAPASNSLLPFAEKEPKGLRKERAFLRSTSVMLSPPLSDESSSQNGDEASRQRSEAGVLQTAVTPWAGHEDLSTTPVLYAQSFGSDCHTPAIEALTCLESFSDSGKLKPFLPTVDGQSLLRSSVMIHTPPPSDHSAGSDDQSRRADGGHHSPESQAAQPGVKNSPEQHTSVSDCSNADWKDYYTDHYWSCPSPSSKVQDCDVPTKDQANGGLDAEKLPRIHNACKEKTSKTSETESRTTNCKAKNGLDDGAQKETMCSAYIPISGTNTESGVQMASVQSLVEPQEGSHKEHMNRNNYFESETGTLLGIQKQHKVLLEAPHKSLNKLGPYISSKQDKKEDDRESAKVLGCVSEVHATNVLKAMPSRSIQPYYLKSDLMSENGFQEIINPSEDIQEAVDNVKGSTNSVMRKSGHLHQESSIPELSVLPEPHPQNNLNLPENHSTKTQSVAARKEADTATRASVQIASSASSSETDVGSDDRGQTPQISNVPATSEKTASKGVTQTVASTTVARSVWQEHAYSLSVEESRAGKWRPQQKSRQHRPARHPQHLFTAKAQAPGSTQSHGADGTVHSTDDAHSTEQSYSDLENMSCSFNFLREASSPALKDTNNNILLPVKTFSSHTCFQTLSGGVQATQGHESKADTATAHDNCMTATTLSTTGSDTAPPQQNRKRVVSVSELKTRMYMVTKVKAMEVGLRIQRYSSGHENGTADSQDYFTYTTNRQNEEYRCSKTEVKLSACKKAQEQAVSARNTISDVTYNIKNTQKQHALHCIAEGETERVGERTTGCSQGRVTRAPQITETAEGRAVEHAICSEILHSEVPRIRDRQEDSSAENGPMSLTGKPTAVFQEPLPTTAAGDKHKSKPRRSSNYQDCSSVGARKRDVQDTFANLSFDNHFEILSTSAPAFYRANCEMLTSTPVVTSQRKDGNMMHDFFNPSQSVEQSCIWEMSAKAHLTSQDPQKPLNVNVHGDNEAQNVVTDNKGKGNVDNPDSPEHQRKMTDPPKVQASPTSVEIQTSNFTAHTNRPSHPDAPPAHAPLPSNLLPTCGGTVTCSAKNERDGQARQHSKDDPKTSHSVNPPETMAESCPEVLNEVDEKIASETRTAKAGVHEPSEDLYPASSEDGRLAPSKRVPADLLSVRPRPRPLLPTPAYRRSPLSGSTPPCPHCLTLLQHSGPGFPPGPGAVDWFLPCPQGCGCGHADRCLHRPFRPLEEGGGWGRAYNGPAAICVHHGGTSQSSLPPGPRSQSGPPDADRRRVACGFLQQPGGSRHQEHRAAPSDTAGVVTAARVSPAEGPPTRESGTGSTTKARRKSVQRHKDAKPEKTGAPHQQASAVITTVSKADAEGEARVRTSRGSSSRSDGDHKETDMDLKGDVVPLLMVTWTLLLLSLTVAVHGGHTDRRSQGQQQ